RQVLPAYGLQDLPPAKPTPLPQTTPGGGSFYLAKYRNFLFCVDSKIGGRGEAGSQESEARSQERRRVSTLDFPDDCFSG
ncbi:MAG TPA: hypothetical protein VFQ24_10705, partial [Terriglobia bacterium]|nr:hypothetical protein [Terriglobia bacterium]